MNHVLGVKLCIANVFLIDHRLSALNLLKTATSDYQEALETELESADQTDGSYL